VVACAALVAYALLPWEWSFVDDDGSISRLTGAQATYGWLPGIAQATYESMRFDLSWGLFRPAYWVYTATFYALPVGVAHALRLAMLAVAVAGPVAIVARRTVARRTATRRRLAMSSLTGLALLADPSLYLGLWYPSLQELSALSCVGLGLLVPRRVAVRVVLFAFAAWFKAPFVWLLLAYGIALWLRRESRRSALLALGLAAVTLTGIALFAHGGFYEGSMHLTTRQLRTNLDLVSGLIGPALITVVGGVLALGTRTRTPSALSIAMLTGGLAYLANLLPWGLGIGSYYAAPWVYLLTTGTVLLLCDGPTPSRTLMAGTLSACVAWVVLTDLPMLHQGLGTASNVNELRDCVMRLPDRSAIGYNRVEGWIRLQQIVLRHKPGWHGHIYLVVAGATGAANNGQQLDYYIEQHGYPRGADNLRSGPVVCGTSQSTVYQVVAGSGR
jgi:hypothetical protein